MSDPDTPTVRSGAPDPGPSAVLEALLAAYVLAAEGDAPPPLQHWLGQLATNTERERFLALVDEVAFAERNLPLRLRPQLVLGGRYELLESIGSGGMGQVWRAHDRKLDHEVAVKVLSLAASAALDLDRLVERESRLLAQLSHPGIVRIQDAGRDGEHRFLVMELVGGRPLDDLVEAVRNHRDQRREPLTGRELLQMVGNAPAGRTPVLDGSETWPVAAVKLVVELLRTLEAAHGAGVVHRDLKPANVRVAGGGVPVLLDFGISLRTGAALGTMTASLFGTAQYSAPEQWEGSAVVGVRTDVYQVGLLLYELLTLRRCFNSTSPIETMKAVRSALYPRPRQLDRAIDSGLEACVLRAMDIVPAQRYGSAREFREDLQRHLDGEVPRAAAGLAMGKQRLRAFGRRHRRWVSFAAAAVLGAVGVGLLRHEPEGLQWLRANQTEVYCADAKLMAAFRIAMDAGGTVYCAPLRLDSAVAQDQLSFGHQLPAGTTEVSLRDVADPTNFASSMVSFVFVDANDPEERRRFGRFVDAMEQARRDIERHAGDWPTEAEFRALLQDGRGAQGLDVPLDRLFATGQWYSGGLSGQVLASGAEAGS